MTACAQTGLRALAGILVLFLPAALGAAAHGEEYVWLEGEKPSRSSIETAPAAWGNRDYLSEEAWLNLSIPANEVEGRIPPGGVILEYDLTVAGAGRYEVWNRIGYESVRSPFQWRMDAALWQDVAPEALTTDLMEIAFWNEVAWLKMGEVDLAPGKHTLAIRHALTYADRDGKKEPQRVLYASDALCVYKGSFRPNGRFKLGEPWQGELDKQAAEHLFEVAASAAPGERVDTPLSGLWQIARADEQVVQDRLGPMKELPPAEDLFWRGIRVPGDRNRERPELVFCHRYFYRARVKVPSRLRGRSFFLHFPSTNMVATVFVNGRPCGWNKAPFAAWDCDVTKAIMPGSTNEVLVGIKDTYYAIADDTRRAFNLPASLLDGNQGVSMRFDMPVWNQRQNGILEPPALVTTGPVYVADVFAAPSVKRKELALEVMLRNPTDSEQTVVLVNEVVPLEGGPPARRFAPATVTVPGGGERTLRLAERWDDAELWWPDSPHQYLVVTRVEADGRRLDRRLTKFGFREWEWDGPQFRLNGVPWQLRADISGDGRPEEALRMWREHGQTMWRFWGTGWAGMTQQETLDFMDAGGMPVRRSGIFDGEMAAYRLTETTIRDGREVTIARTALFDNWIEQLKAWVRAERNHSSIFIWSLENEIVFINSINFGTISVVSPEIARAAREVMALDPTRPVMVDGGRALPDMSLPVNGCHYNDPDWRELPDAAYSMDYLREPRFHEGWSLRPDAPVFLGEAFFARGSNPSAFSVVCGEQAFLGRAEARAGVDLLARMMSEGYRWQGLGAFHFWFGGEDTLGRFYTAWQPVCALCREWNWTFGGGSTVRRTLKVLNDTRHADPITVTWQFVLNGQPVAGGASEFSPPAGRAQETEVTFVVPRVENRMPAQFSLTCRRRGEEVFRDVKEAWVVDADGAPKPSVGEGQLAVWDTDGSVRARLNRRGIPFREFTGWEDLPADARLIVVGKDALSGRDATDPRWKDLAAAGARVLVLDQKVPLHYQAVPADLEPTEYVGRVAFPEDLGHPAFAGLDTPDFFTWSGDHVVYRSPYKKASQGARSLAQCDAELGCSALSECPIGEGLLVLCQFAVGGKLESDPVAQRLFDNLLGYCASYQPVRKRTAVAVPEGSAAGQLLKDIGLQFAPVPDALSAVSEPSYDIVVAEASPAALKALAENRDAVQAFTARGGWLMLWGLTPEGLADYNRVVGVQHLLRPFELERVALPAVRDPILSGLTMRDVVMESGQRIYAWAGDRFMASDAFTYLVDLDDIAPFCEFPGPEYWRQEGAQPGADHWPRNMVNGFTTSDSWRYCFSILLDRGEPTAWTLKLPREEEVIGFSIVPNTIYRRVTKVRLTFDGDRAGVVELDVRPVNERQDFEFAGHRARALTIEIARWDAVGSGNVVGVDNLWIRVRRPPDFYKRVRPLLNIGALVKYPMGAGGVILNQLRVLDTEGVPVNAQKKRTIVATLLRNLSAVFEAGPAGTPAAGGMRCEPVLLEDKCNQYLTGGENRWFKDVKGRSLSHFPVGEGAFAGVTFLVRDFKTSPLPSCIMLNGTGDHALDGLPLEVTGIPVHRKADALFFLHTFNQYGRPQRGEGQDPVVFQYTVRYADGQAVVIPVRLGIEVGHWLSADPRGLKGAALAWAAAFPNDDSGEQAAVYQMEWRNPRPDVEVSSVDVSYGALGNRYGMPAVLALSAGAAPR